MHINIIINCIHEKPVQREPNRQLYQPVRSYDMHIPTGTYTHTCEHFVNPFCRHRFVGQDATICLRFFFIIIIIIIIIIRYTLLELYICRLRIM